VRNSDKIAPSPGGRKKRSHTFTNLLTYVIFSTKDRASLITAALHDDLLAYLGGIVREFGGALRAANARPDHVHLLFTFGRDLFRP
jgi:REP element-mobilizing transposase RayT